MKRLRTKLPPIGARVREVGMDSICFVVSYTLTSDCTRVGMAYSPGGTEAISCTASDFGIFWEVLS
jgi:hypothetical protein